jgi:hypothetical protein
MINFVNPKNDIAFKKIFGNEQRKVKLKSLVQYWRRVSTLLSLQRWQA